MSNGSGVTLEGVHAEVEKLGGIIRSLSTQLASMRARVTDMEEWDLALEAAGRGKGKGKAKAKAKKKARRKRKKGKKSKKGKKGK